MDGDTYTHPTAGIRGELLVTVPMGPREILRADGWVLDDAQGVWRRRDGGVILVEKEHRYHGGPPTNRKRKRAQCKAHRRARKVRERAHAR